METKVINGTTIYVKDGKKYRKPPHGKLRELCQVEDCIKRTQDGCGHYCIGCLNELSSDDPIKMKQLIENSKRDFKKKNEEIDANYKAKVEEAKTVIDGVDIYIIDFKKYRKNHIGKLVPACSYDKCNKFAHHNQSYVYCNNHKGGTNPTDESRKKEIDDMKSKAKATGKVNIKVGNATESWVATQLKSIKSIQYVEVVGFTGSKYDIEVKLNNEDEPKGIQVKTLIKSKRYKDSYGLKTGNVSYSDNTLFIGVNNDRNRFILMFYKDFKNKHPTFNYSSGKSEYQKYMFTDYNKFIQRLRTIVSKIDVCDINCRQEYLERENESLLRLKAKCTKSNLKYNRVNDASEKIDCVINGHNIQHKTSNVKSCASYIVGIQKNNGKSNGKRMFLPYSDKDGIDFFIFEIIDFKNNFYIVPINVLIEKGYIQTETITGKKRIYIPIPNGKKKTHWINKYLNNFDLLK